MGRDFADWLREFRTLASLVWLNATLGASGFPYLVLSDPAAPRPAPEGFHPADVYGLHV